MDRLKLLGFLIAIPGLIAPSAFAQDAVQNDKVKVTVQPYIWVPTLNGSARLGQIEAPVHIVPRDFVDGFQLGAMGHVKIEHKGRFVYADAIFVDYDNRSFRPFFGQPLLSKIRYHDFGVGLTKSLRLNDSTSLTLAPQVGVQHVALSADVNGSLIVAKATGKWWSPSAGLTARLPITKSLSAELAVNAASFGLGRTNYQSGSAELRYRLGRRWNIAGGCRMANGRYD